jgi:transposase-like protein
MRVSREGSVMTEMMSGMSVLTKSIDKTTVKPGDGERAVIREMVRSAKERGLDITGPDGLLRLFTKTVLETALEEEMTEHLGYDKHDPEGRNGGNSRNGTRTKTVISDAAGEVTIEVPRDRDGSFAPVIVKKRQRRLGDVDKIVLSLYGKGMTTGEISAHFAEIYGVSVSSSVVSVITEKVVEEQQAWNSRPLHSHYVAVFVDALYVKVRDGAVANRPFYAAIGFDLRGHRDVLGVWAGTPGAGESAKFWIQILTELKNRGVEDIFYLVTDGLIGMPESVNVVFKETIVQSCLVHLIRNTYRYSSKKYWAEIARDLKPVYTAVSPQAAEAAFEVFDEKWGERYPAISKLWRSAWENFIPFLDLDIEIRHLLSTTNAIESLNARFRKVIDARGHFPNEQAAMKVLYLAVRSLDPKGTGQQRWITRWKPILNVIGVLFSDRIPETANL